MSDVEFKIGANSTDANAALDKLAAKAMTTGQRMQSSMRDASYNMASGMKNSADKIDTEFGRMGKMADLVKSRLIMVSAVLTAGMGIQRIVDVASEFEQLEIRLKAVMGTASAGKEAFAWIKQFAVDTPNSVKDVTDAFMMLKNFGIDPMDGSLRKISDAAGKYGKDAQSMQSITLALGQAWGLGKLQGQDMMQMVNAGLPVWDMLASATGKTSEELHKMSEKGQLGRDVMRQLIDEMGRVSAGASSDKMNSYAGAVSNMGDAFANAVDQMRSTGSFNFITESIQAVTELIPPTVALFSEAFSAIGDVVSVAWGIISDIFAGIRDLLNSVFGSGSEGVTALQFFKNIINLVSVTLMEFRFIFQTIVTTIKALLAELVNYFMTAFNVIERAVHLDFSGAKSAFKAGFNDMKGIAKEAANEIASNYDKTGEKIRDAILGTSAPKVADHKVAPIVGGGTGTTKKAISRTGEWDVKLAEVRDAYEKQKLEQSSFEEFGKAHERDYWKNILDTVKMSTEERRQVSSKYYALERDLRKTAYENEIAEMRSNLNAYRAGGVERIQIAGEIAQKAGQKYGLESKEYKAAVDDMQQMAKARTKQQEQLDSMELERTRTHQISMLELEQVRIEESAAMGDITESQKLTALAKLKEEEFQIELKAAIDRAAFLTDDVLAYQGAMDKILEIKQKHELDKAKVMKEIKVADKKQFDDMFAPLEKSFEKSVNGMIAGTTTLSKGIKNMAQSAALEYANMGVKMAVHWAANQIRMTMATAAGEQARVGIKAGAAAQGTAIGAAASLKSIMNSAAEAAAGAYKAVVGIPFIGPVLAPVAAGVAFAATAAFGGSVASAEGGYDIPAGMNPMTQLHEREMVLPQKQADAVRDMANGSGSGGVVNIHTKGGDYVHKNDLAKLLKSMNRNFVFIK